jgi:hypothetical protein
MLALGIPQAAAGATVSPLSESNYRTHNACSAPEPGHAGCLALELVPQTTAAREHTHPLGMTRSLPIKAASPREGAYGLRPEDLRDAYFAGESDEAPPSEPQTIALVDAYNDPKAQQDLETYEKEFGLNKCSAATSACFEQVNQNGETANLPFPASEAARRAELSVCENIHETTKKREAACEKVAEAEGWAVEISTDIEASRAVCQNCKILLVEAESDSYQNLEAAEETAVALHATEISNSWGGPEEGFDSHAFNHAETVITAAAGDDGYLNWTEAEEAEQARKKKEATGYFVGADYPASSPYVVAVGGTKLEMNGGVRESETVWNEDPGPEGGNQGAGGGGCSGSFTAQPWQEGVLDWSQVGCGSKRAVADISADADPYTGVAIYDSVPDLREEDKKLVNTPLEWWPIGGTSVASPIIASMFALAGGAHGVAYPAKTLYSHIETAALYHVTKGGNGQCDDLYTSCSGSLDQLSPSFPFDCGEGSLICNAAPGCGRQYYDGPTGVGTPDEIAAFEPGVLPALAKPECEQTSKPSKEEVKKEEAGSQGSISGGSNGNGSSAAQPTSSQGSTSGGSTTDSNGPSGTSSPQSSKTAKQTARISDLTLTANARTALHHSMLGIAQLAFSCELSRAATVRVTLTVRVNSGNHMHWRTLPTSLRFAAVEGLNRRRLHGSHRLSAGVYRLLLAPTGGAARALVFRVP